MSYKGTYFNCSFSGLLFLLFLALKLTGVIAWSWVWVTAPLWVPAVAVTGILLLVLLITLILR